MAAAKPVRQPLPSLINKSLKALLGVFLAAALGLPAALFVFLGRAAPPPLELTEAPVPEPPPAEKDPALMSFFHELWSGPAAVPLAQALPEDYGPIPQQIAKIEGLFSTFNHFKDAEKRAGMLLEFAQGLYGLKRSCTSPGLQVVWQCVSILERLVRELAHKESEITHSSLRTVAGGLDLLRILAKAENLNPHLVTDPPVKLLVVDDNAVCLRAIAMALKNAFPGLDLADNGASGLSLAQASAYDAVFLDVEMPGMDGFELCTKIHQTTLNQKTPVIFVTSHSDFDSRAKSALCGGHELIGKPFLPLEIACKAFSLVAGWRFRKSQPAAEQPPSARLGPATPAKAQEAQDKRALVRPSEVVSSSPAPATDHSKPNGIEAASLPEDTTQVFFAQAPERLHTARLKLQVLPRATDPDTRRVVLESLRLGMQLLAAEAQRAELDPAHRLAFAIQALLSKLVERPDCFTQSCQSALATAVEVLDQLCLPGASLEALEPAPRILVVDDDPVARRAISGALQCNFGKPQTADSGEAALALAEREQFDLIFMDVRMPGMDGFAACTTLRQTALNSDTPVVFVTSLGDAESRHEAALVDGSGFIVKPVLPSEIRLTAITFSIRSRLSRDCAELVTA